MKSYAVRTAKTPEDAEAQMNEMAREGSSPSGKPLWLTGWSSPLKKKFNPAPYLSWRSPSCSIFPPPLKIW